MVGFPHLPLVKVAGILTSSLTTLPSSRDDANWHISTRQRVSARTPVRMLPDNTQSSFMPASCSTPVSRQGVPSKTAPDQFVHRPPPASRTLPGAQCHRRGRPDCDVTLHLRRGEGAAGGFRSSLCWDYTRDPRPELPSLWYPSPHQPMKKKRNQTSLSTIPSCVSDVARHPEPCSGWAGL